MDARLHFLLVLLIRSRSQSRPLYIYLEPELHDVYKNIVMKEMFILKHVDTRLHFFTRLWVRSRSQSRPSYGLLEPEVHDVCNYCYEGNVDFKACR